MLQSGLLAEMLDDEVDLAIRRLGDRAAGLAHNGRYITCPVSASDGTAAQLRLDASRYDGDPVRVDVCDQHGTTLPSELWPGSLFHSIHPVTNAPFVCIRGTFEYHIYPGHNTDRWDAVRPTLRIADVLDHLLRKAGR